MKNEKLIKIKELLASVLLDEEAKEQKFGSISTDIAVIYWDGEEDLKEGDLVYTADENGENKVQAEDGEYKLEDGTIYKVENGRVAEIIVPEVEPENNPEPEAQEPEAPETEVNAEDEPEAPEEPAKEEEKPEAPEEDPEKVEEEVRDLAKEIDELKELVAELSKKLEAVEKEAPKTPAEEFEAMKDEDEKIPMAVKYAQALRK